MCECECDCECECECEYEYQHDEYAFIGCVGVPVCKTYRPICLYIMYFYKHLNIIPFPVSVVMSFLPITD